jgi:hypothetical protein
MQEMCDTATPAIKYSLVMSLANKFVYHKHKKIFRIAPLYLLEPGQALAEMQIVRDGI